MRAGSDVKVTWLDGLPSKVAPEDWHFEPNYRGSEDIDDLVSLPVLNENVLLDELCKRFCCGRIYTYVGGILIAALSTKQLQEGMPSEENPVTLFETLTRW